jgi:hypothetical protein
MMTRSLLLALTAYPALLVAQETPIKRSDLPAAVARTVAAQGRGATLKGLSREAEGGKTFYEAEFVVGGKGRDVLIDTGGTVVEVEEEVSLADLPAPVQAGLKAKAGGGSITKVESLTKGGRLVAYEARVKTAGKMSEIQVGPDGKALAKPE